MKANTVRLFVVWSALLPSAISLTAGPLDTAWLKGTTDKDPLSYRCGDDMALTIELMGVEGAIPEGEYSMQWTRTDDFGGTESGSVPLPGKPFTYRTRLDKPGFVRLTAYVVGKDGIRYEKKFIGDATTPEGRKAMNAFEKAPKNVFFDGGVGADVAKLRDVAEPADFDEFWDRQFARLDKVPVMAEKLEIDSGNPKTRLYAVRIDCAGLRPVTGYLSVPRDAEQGRKYPCVLHTHGYSGDRCLHKRPGWVGVGKIVLDINAHGLKLEEFGATDADTKAFRWEIRSNGKTYAFDAEQNKDPETAYFNGMVLRVKRALQYLKTLEGWNGRNLYASGGSQGGLQTIWAAACGEGVTVADSGITWCCDMKTNASRAERKASEDGWYIPWTESMGYYDAVNWGKRIPTTCRTNITRAGLGDYCCPPMGLAKLYNNIPGNKSIKWVQGSRHGYVPPEYEGRDFYRESP